MVAEDRHDAGRVDDIGARGDFDPRYDPAFQRGYRPQPGERPRTRMRTEAPEAAFPRPAAVRGGGAARATTQVDGSGDYDRYADPLPEAPPDPVGLAIASTPLAVVQPLDGASPPVVVSSPSILSRLELSPRRNPFVLALWIVGGGFVVLGIVLYAVSVSASYSGPTPSTDVGSLVFAQLGWMLAGPLITVGLLTLVALLFLTALAGRRLREPDMAEDDTEL